MEARRVEAVAKAREREAIAREFEQQEWQRAAVLPSDDDFDSGKDVLNGESSGEISDSDAEGGVGSGEGDGEGAEDGEQEPEGWDCVACDKYFQSEAAWLNHERSKKHKKAVEKLKSEMRAEDDELELDIVDDGANVDTASPDAQDGEQNQKSGAGAVPLADDVEAMGLEDYADDEDLDLDDGEDFPAGISIPLSKSAKNKKKKKRRGAAGGVPALDDDAYFVQALNRARTGANGAPRERDVSSKKAGQDQQEGPAKVHVQETAAPPPAALAIGPPASRPEGSFDVFGYGSLIFKPPPHIIGATPGFIKGFARRFAQHSVDHRGTPEKPGRVVTLIAASDWHRFEAADDTPEGDIVWGVSYTIHPAHATEVRAYLDHREKNGYTPTSADIWAMKDGKEEVVVKDALVYVGLPDNEAFVGPAPLDELAQRIFECEGPSGKNDAYLLSLAEAIRGLAPESVDNHLFTLEEKVLALKRASSTGEVAKRGEAEAGTKEDDDAQTPAPAGKKGRKGKKPPAEVSMVARRRDHGPSFRFFSTIFSGLIPRPPLPHSSFHSTRTTEMQRLRNRVRLAQ